MADSLASPATTPAQHFAATDLAPLLGGTQLITSASHDVTETAWSLGRQMASLFLGAVAFAVAMAWNSAVQSLIQLWTPPKDFSRSTRQSTARYNLIAASALTVVAVALAAFFTWIYGKSVRVGQAKTYGLG